MGSTVSEKPRISDEVMDVPTQRFYTFAAFLLIQSAKLADAVLPASSSSPTSDLDWNWALLKWIVLDLITLQVVRSLRIPRLSWSWKGVCVAVMLLVASDYFLFGRWQFSLSMLLPTFLQSFFSTYRSTTETRVRLDSIMAKDDSHLAGHVTVHILAVSTAHLNPASTSFCLATLSNPKPVHVPLILNNTTPTQLTYTITSLFDASSVEEVTIPSSSLIRPSSAVVRAAEPVVQDELDEWAFGTPKPSVQPLRHRLVAPPPSEESDPFDLSPSQTLYYLPISSIGIVHIKSVLDAEGVPVRLRRLRSSVDAGDVRILRCPQGGFATKQAETHTCLTRSSVDDSRTLNLQVTGWQPLSVRWHAVGGKTELLESISSPARMSESIVSVPLNVSLAKAGGHKFVLDSVTDGSGNTASFDSDQKKSLIEGTIRERTFVVHQPPEIAFSGACGKGEDVRLLSGEKATLELKLTAVERAKDRKDDEWTLGVRFTPEHGSKGWESDIVVTNPAVRLQVDGPGLYEVISLRNRWCEGAVLAPSLCTVIAQPMPALITSFSPLLDACNSEIGAQATLLLTGAPPFVVSYSLTQLSPIRRTLQRTEHISHSRSTLRLEPGPGEWEYRFTKLQDAFYRDIALPSDPQFTRKQSVQLTGAAEWKGASQDRVVHSCEGSTVAVEVALSGLPPWELEYTVAGSKVEVIKGIDKQSYPFDIAIPDPIAQRGGQFSLTLVSVTDGKGCRKPLTVDDLVIDVRRTKPTARFHGSHSSRSVLIRENDSAKIPLRLTGEGPWTISYLAPPSPSNPNGRHTAHEFRATQPNMELELARAAPGTYVLTGVRDRFCGGDVSETEWVVKTLPRPTLRLAFGSGKLAKNGTLIRAPVCLNSPDSVEVQLEGKAPWKAAYTLIKSSHPSEKLSRTLQAINSRAELTLFTASPGRHSYQFTGVADSLYTTADSAGLIIPTGGRAGLVRMEQEVFPLPTAAFKQGPSSDFCINDKLSSRGANDLILDLEGLPPFTVDLEVRTEGSRVAERFTVSDIDAHEWPITVPLTLSTPAVHTIHVRRVVDGRSCRRVFEREDEPSTSISTTISVAEIATITPVVPQENHCVGDFLDFVVQGQPPFTVSYDFNGQAHVVSDVKSKFSRLATAPGEFRIRSVGHGQDQCRSSDVGLVKKIFALPTAKVHHGEDIFVDIREGDQTEITFSFTGEPPFTFTYVRRLPQDRTHDRTILETHTVAGIMEHSYSIFTAQEGTWSVSFVADAHCSFPHTVANE